MRYPDLVTRQQRRHAARQARKAGRPKQRDPRHRAGARFTWWHTRHVYPAALAIVTLVLLAGALLTLWEAR